MQAKPTRAACAPVFPAVQELREHYGIPFNSLLCLNNMPIKRWAEHLVKE